MVVVALLLSVRPCCPSTRRPAPAPAPTGRHAPAAPGPGPAYRCSFNANTDAFTGADGTASAIGWLADHRSVVTCLGGTFLVQDGPDGVFQNDGFGIYDGQRVTWVDADGYLPAQVTTFDDHGATVSITEFADEIAVGGNPFVAVYSRVRVANPTDHTVTANPEASPSLVPLDVVPMRCRRTMPSTTTSSWSPIASGVPRRGPTTRRSPPQVVSTSTSPTCAPSGTPSSPPLRRSACLIHSW